MFCNLNVCQRAGCPNFRCVKIYFDQREYTVEGSGDASIQQNYINRVQKDGISRVYLQIAHTTKTSQGSFSCSSSGYDMAFCFMDERYNSTVPKTCPYFVEMVVLGDNPKC